MSLLLPELKNALIQAYDVMALVEMLEISSEELLEAFSDTVEEKYEALCLSVEEEDVIEEKQ